MMVATPMIEDAKNEIRMVAMKRVDRADCGFGSEMVLSRWIAEMSFGSMVRSEISAESFSRR